MDSADFLALAERTVSTKYHADRVPLNYFLRLVLRMDEMVQEVDDLRKELFQGFPNAHHDLLGSPIPGETNDYRAGFEMFVDEAQDSQQPMTVLRDLKPELLQAALTLFIGAFEILQSIQRPKLNKDQLVHKAGDLEWALAVLYGQIKALPEEARAQYIEVARRRFPESFAL